MRPRVHVFGDHLAMDYVVRQAELIRRYEYLVDHLLTTLPPYPFDQSQTLTAWLEQLEVSVVTEAVARTGGAATAMALLGESGKRHFGTYARKRQAYARRPFAQVVAERHGHTKRGRWIKGVVPRQARP